VTQEVFLQAFKNLRKLKNFDSFAIWLSSIASNLSKKWIRSNIRRPDREFIEDKDPKTIEEPSIESYQDSEISESFREALDSLPEIYQQVLTLHYLGGMSGMEIARTLGISHDTVRQRLSRARIQLREEMTAMMNQTFQQQKLSASFTFRIVELVKKIKINPVSEAKGLPWGLSLGAGLIFAVLMIGQHIQINLPDIAMGLPLPSEMKVLKVGEIPVEAVKISTIASIGSKGDGKGVAPDPKGQENTFLAPQAEGDKGGKWVKKADMSTARLGHSVTEVNGKIYAMGGLSPNGFSSAVEEYDPITDKWTTKSPMPTARVGLTTAVVNGKIYTMGGLNGSMLSVVEEYDPTNDSWKKKTSMPFQKLYHSAVVINNEIYVVGGLEDFNNFIPSPSISVYDPTLDKWSNLKDIPPQFKVGLSASVAFNDKIYFFGGMYLLDFSVRKNILVYNPSC
jgi:RNA polymerase sigma factor (sigma-70 family)